MRLIAALFLVTFGMYKLVRPRSHPAGGGMRVGRVRLAGWSFLMSSAHGAGLMLAPVLLGLPVADHYSDLRMLSVAALGAASVHVAAMLAVMAVVAVVVYERVGLAFLRRGWFNLDLAWTGVLLVPHSASLACTLATPCQQQCQSCAQLSGPSRWAARCNRSDERSVHVIGLQHRVGRTGLRSEPSPHAVDRRNCR